MSTIFSYLWANQIKKNRAYDKYPYNVLADEIICITVGSPACMSTLTAQRFCNYVITSNNTEPLKKILYIRIVTQGDPIPGLPPNILGFRHPCYDSLLVETTKRCNGLLTMLPVPNINYNLPLQCTHKKKVYLPNVTSHLNYIGILFGTIMKDSNHPDKTPNSKNIAREVWRTSTGATVGRLIMGSYSTNIKLATSKYEYKVVFFNLNQLRKNSIYTDNQDEYRQIKPTIFRLFKIPYKIGGSVLEDVKMTPDTFNMLLDKMYIICSVNKSISLDIVPDTIANFGMCDTNLCPLQTIGAEPVWANFNSQEMPELSTVSSFNDNIETDDMDLPQNSSIHETKKNKSHKDKKMTRKYKK